MHRADHLDELCDFARDARLRAAHRREWAAAHAERAARAHRDAIMAGRRLDARRDAMSARAVKHTNG